MIAGRITLRANLHGNRFWQPDFPIGSTPTRVADDNSLDLRSVLVFGLTYMSYLAAHLDR